MRFFWFEDKNRYPIYVSQKCCENKYVDLLSLGEGGKKHYFLIKDFNKFMCDCKLHHGRKHFCRYCLRAVRTADILTCLIKGCFKVNDKQRIKMPAEGEYVRFKKYEKKIKLPF